MRTVGRPSRERVIAGPFEKATGMSLRAALLAWDADGVTLPQMAKTILQFTGEKISGATLLRLIREYRGERQGKGTQTNTDLHVLARTEAPADVPDGMFVGVGGLAGFH